MSRPKLIASIVGYAAWFCALYLLLTWATFPWSRAEDQIRVVGSQAGWAVEVDDLSSAFFGVSAKGLRLQPKSGEGGVPAGGIGGTLLPTGITMDSVRLGMPMTRVLSTALALRSGRDSEGITPIALLDSAGKVSLDSEFWDGYFDFSVERGEESTRLSLDADDLNLKNWKIQAGILAADPQGKLRSKGGIVWHDEDPKKSSGSFDLFFDDLIIPELPALGTVTFSKSEVHLKLGRGRAEIRNSSFEADEVQAIVEGFATLAKNPMRSRLSLKVRFKVRDDLDPLLGAVIGSKKHKDNKGWYHYQLSGTLQKPRFRPSTSAARRNKPRPSPRSKAVDPADSDDEVAPGPSSARTNNPDRVERKRASDEERIDADAQRSQLREERARRRAERKERREEMMRKRRERQAELNQGPEADVELPELDIDLEAVRPVDLPVEQDEGEEDNEGEEEFEEEEE